MDRREFMQTLAAVVAVGTTGSQTAAGAEPRKHEKAKKPLIPQRVLGRTGVKVSAIIIGGVVGMKSLEHLRVNVAAAGDGQPLNKDERRRLEKHMA